MRKASGELHRTPIRDWDEIDWDAVERSVEIGIPERDRDLLSMIASRGEPTRMLADEDDPDPVELVLRRFEQHGLVFSVREPSGLEGRAMELEDWWP